MVGAAWLERYGGGPGLDLRPAAAIAEHEAAVAKAGGHRIPPVPQGARERTHQQPPEAQACPEQLQRGETLLQRILRLAREGPVSGTSTPATTPDPTPDPTPRAPSPQPSSRTLSSTSEREVVDVQLQYDESSRLQNEHLALRPKAKPRPKVRHDPRHGAMAADAGGDDGDGDRRGDEDPMRRRGTGEPTPESEDEDENEEDVEETETPEYMVRMKRRSGWLTQGGKRNWARAGKSSAWQLQKLRRSKGHTVL